MKKIIGFLFLLFFTMLPKSGFAIVPATPVIDLEQIMRTMELIKHAKKQFEELKDIKENGVKNLEFLKQQSSYMTGHYGYSSIDNKPNLQNWGTGSNFWEQVLNVYQQGGNPGDVGSVAKTLERQYPIKSASEVYPYNAAQGQYYELQAKTTLASRALSQVSFDRVSKEIEMLDELKDEIEKSPNQKATLDLIARVQIESALIQTQIERLLATLLQQTSVNSQAEPNGAVATHHFFDW